LASKERLIRFIIETEREREKEENGVTEREGGRERKSGKDFSSLKKWYRNVIVNGIRYHTLRNEIACNSSVTPTSYSSKKLRNFLQNSKIILEQYI
jgi:hypothetical protein